jgi:hypothetical protein
MLADGHGHETGSLKLSVKRPKYAKIYLRAYVIFNIFPGVIPPDPAKKGRGG